MSFSRTALALGFLVLNACSVGTVTASSAHEASTPVGGATMASGGNTPTSSERPNALAERATMAGHSSPAAEPRSLGAICRRCIH